MFDPMVPELRVRCGDCGHRWVAAYIPMEMGKFVRLLSKVCCPKCAAPLKRILCGWPDGAGHPAPAEAGEHHEPPQLPLR